MTKEKKAKKSVIFLDIDFVLNEASSKEMFGKYTGVDDSKISILKDIATFLNADIVLISSWRAYWKPGLDLKKSNRGKYGRGRYLDKKLAAYGLSIIDKTQETVWWKRGQEIIDWLKEHPEVTRFVILDDEDFRWAKYGLEKHWVNTYERSLIGYDGGLQFKHLEYIIDNVADFSRKDLA